MRSLFSNYIYGVIIVSGIWHGVEFFYARVCFRVCFGDIRDSLNAEVLRFFKTGLPSFC